MLTLLPGSDPVAGGLQERLDRLRGSAAFLRETIEQDVPDGVGRVVALALIGAGLEIALQQVQPETAV